MSKPVIHARPAAVQGPDNLATQLVRHSELDFNCSSAYSPVLSPQRTIDEITSQVECSLVSFRLCKLKEEHMPIYIPTMAKASLQAEHDDIFPLMKKVHEFLDSDRQVLLILGDSGSGKTTFCRKLEHRLWANYNSSDPIPLFINLPTIERPDQNMIKTQLLHLNFSDDEIQDMKMHRQFILICDGYDESQQVTNLHTTNRLNRQDGWQVKMIVSCRTQFLSPEYLDSFVPQLDGYYSEPRLDLFQEVMIVPLLDEQVKDYVARWVSLDIDRSVSFASGSLSHPWTVADYMTTLTTIPNLMDLVKNPFLLTLALDALPRITKSQQDPSSINVTRSQLFEYFVKSWLDVNRLRLESCSLYDDDRMALEMILDAGVESMGSWYSSQLAQEIFDKQDGNPVVQYIHHRHKDTWKADFFTHDDPVVRVLRALCPLSRSGSHHQFIHRSLLEFFFSCSIFDHNGDGDQDDWASSQLDSERSDVQLLDPQGALFTRSLLQEPSVIHFLSERVKQSPDFEKQLRDVIEQSKSDSSTAIAATNAIAILTEAGVPM
ncbi:hypothetical protein BG015_008510 [Linnemannia schmuckeri]|uniref:NACHT domain-containing protein n=1 Tax=Linnemannia schmuckeri TaxID=64567 RepID=A0A9P5VFC7_9FUNG|nr:hypothetical protein BG015_008510 [Linnemannia schmuckeri]